MDSVLIAEDSRTQAEELRLILESEGFAVDWAADGTTALARAVDSAPALVISDILMPGLSGFELCRALKRDPKTKGVPLILLTSLSDPMDIIQALECGADSFVSKPYEPDHLVARVRSILEHRRLRQEGAPKGGVEIVFMGRTFVISSDKEQILNLLVSTFEDTVRTNRQLRASRAETEAANRELEAFSYSVSHDLRAPLRAIDGFSQILFESYNEALDAEGQGYLQRIRAAGQRMGELIDDLLALARVGSSELRRTRLDFSALTSSVVAELQHRDADRKVTVRIEDGLTIHADERLMRIALENLIGNAWKFTSKKPDATIELGAAATSDGAQGFFVRDNGAGFDMAYGEKLFQAFRRLHSDSEFPGTGIGLATVRRIVERHGGRIWAEGRPGAGATFHFTLSAGPGAHL